jgi:hypothetical protein
MMLAGDSGCKKWYFDTWMILRKINEEDSGGFNGREGAQRAPS